VLFRSIEKMLGAALPPMKDDSKDAEDVKVLPPEIEAQLAQLVAQAAAKLLQKNTSENQQKQAQEQAKDPLIQMQQQELKIKESDVQRKAKKDSDDAAAKQAELQLKTQMMQSQQQLKMQELQAKQQLDSAKLSIEVARGVDQSGHQSQQRTNDFTKHREQLAHQQRQLALQAKQTKEPNV